MYGILALRIKHEWCRALASKYYRSTQQSVSYDGCESKFSCNDISNDLYETVDENNGLTITAGYSDGWATKQISIDQSQYDSNVNCLEYDGNHIIEKNYFYSFSYLNNDADNCGCYDIGDTIHCYDCYMYFCSDDQPISCYNPNGTPSPTPEPTTPVLQTKNDFCERDYTINIVSDPIICGAMNVDNYNFSKSKLFANDGLNFDELKTSVLWKDKISYLLIVYMNEAENIIYADIFDINGNHIVSNHIIIEITVNSDELKDVEIIVPTLISVDDEKEYKDITDFMIVYRYYDDKIIKYTSSQFTGNSITNIYENKEFIPSISENSNDLYLYDYSSSYLFKTDAFILFGSESSNKISVIVFKLNGNILNENKINFEIDNYRGELSKLSCGFNSTHDICLLDWIYDSDTSTLLNAEYSYGSFIAVELSSDNIAYITIIKEKFKIDYNGNYKYDNSHKPVVITPEYDTFFMQISGGIEWSWISFMSAAIYDLNGNRIINEFNFNNDEEVSLSINCYSSYKSKVIICASASQNEMYLFDTNGDPLIDTVGTLLSEEKLNNYIQKEVADLYSYTGDIIDISYRQLIPLTSNDFWAVFSMEITNSENDIIFAVKISLYDTCCNVYIESGNGDEESIDGESNVFGSGEVNGIDIAIIIGIVVAGIVILVICIVVIVCCLRKKKTNNHKSEKQVKYETVGTEMTMNNENIVE